MEYDRYVLMNEEGEFFVAPGRFTVNACGAKHFVYGYQAVEYNIKNRLQLKVEQVKL